MTVYEKLKSANKPIIIFGAGKTGKFILYLCMNHEIPVKAFCDNGKSGNFIANLPVLTITDAVSTYGKDAMYIITPPDIGDIVFQLAEYDCKNWCSMCEFFSPQAFFDLFSLKERSQIGGLLWIKNNWYRHYLYIHPELLRLFSLDFVITEKCSLKCKECSNLMQYYKEPQNFSYDKLTAELDRVLELYDIIEDLRIIGGEPFMNRDIAKITKYAAKSDKIKQITIYTNGTILPSEEDLDLYDRCAKVMFSISDYGPLSKQFNNWEKALQKRNMPYFVARYRWTRCSDFNKHDRNVEALRNVFANCCVYNAVTLLDGKIYPCPFIANGINLKALPALKEDFVNIMTNKPLNELKQELRTLHKRNFYSLCDYCNGRPNVPTADQTIDPHEQIKKPLNYEEIY